jgi:hypothetical protein
MLTRIQLVENTNGDLSVMRALRPSTLRRVGRLDGRLDTSLQQPKVLSAWPRLWRAALRSGPGGDAA